MEVKLACLGGYAICFCLYGKPGLSLQHDVIVNCYMQQGHT